MRNRIFSIIATLVLFSAACPVPAFAETEPEETQEALDDSSFFPEWLSFRQPEGEERQIELVVEDTETSPYRYEIGWIWDGGNSFPILVQAVFDEEDRLFRESRYDLKTIEKRGIVPASEVATWEYDPEGGYTITRRESRNAQVECWPVVVSREVYDAGGFLISKEVLEGSMNSEQAGQKEETESIFRNAKIDVVDDGAHGQLRVDVALEDMTKITAQAIYDANYRLTVIDWIEGDIQSETYFDAEGRVTSSDLHGTTGHTSQTYQYDLTANTLEIVTEVQSFTDSALQSSTVKYELDDTGRVLREETLDEKGDTVEVQTYEYEDPVYRFYTAEEWYAELEAMKEQESTEPETPEEPENNQPETPEVPENNQSETPENPENTQTGTPGQQETNDGSGMDNQKPDSWVFHMLTGEGNKPGEDETEPGNVQEPGNGQETGNSQETGNGQEPETSTEPETSPEPETSTEPETSPEPSTGQEPETLPQPPVNPVPGNTPEPPVNTESEEKPSLWAAVVSERVRVRSSMDTSGYDNILGVLEAGEMVFCTGMEGTWAQIEWREETGYVSAEFLKAYTVPGQEAKEGELTPAERKTVVEERIRVRATPDTSGDDNILGYLNEGTSVICLGTEGDWSLILYRGQIGYVMTEFLK